MDFPSKIKRVKEYIDQWLEHWDGNDGFSYPILDFSTVNEKTGEENVYITKGEHREVIDYLASKDYLEIIEEKENNSVKLIVPSKPKPYIKLKTLELIARELKEHYTGTEIVNLLKEAKVDPRLIVYPESKWIVFYNVFSELSLSKKYEDHILLDNIICEAIHPLNLDGDQQKSKELQKKFNEYLKYNYLIIAYLDDSQQFRIIDSIDAYPEPTKEELEEMELEFETRSQEELQFFKQPDNKNKISLLRKSFQSIINVVEVFCENPSNVTEELNDAYTELHKIIYRLVNDLNLHDEGGKIYKLNNFGLPFINLYKAEKAYQEKGKSISWEKIRPEMNSIYGDIEEIYKEVNGSDTIAEPEQQKKINDIQLYLSELKEQRKQKDEKSSSTKIEITSIPKLEFKETAHIKNLQKINLKDTKIEYDDDKAHIKINSQIVNLPPQKNEHYFCRAMFQRPEKEFIDWSIIFEDMDKILNSLNKKDAEKDKRMVQDTMYAVNKRIKNVVKTKDDLFTWKEKSIRRNY